MSENNQQDNQNGQYDESGKAEEQVPLRGMYQEWFLDYASYVILERAVPAIEDGFKPVQRRIMHALKELDDGRFNKVANVIGHTMQYHPHGDASIGDAMVNLGQKDLLLDLQGNWGDYRTGDPSAAPRYIEGRLSKFALEVVFNPQTTQWQQSYDGRKKEPITLPVKFPLLLTQGVEGIAVGLSTKILPHNFIELIEASIKILNGKKVKIYPDFLTGGMADVSEYNDGVRGGKVRIRAIIEERDKKTLIIKSVPYGVTTNTLIDSIIKANDKGKIKIKSVIDATAKDIEIIVNLASGQSPDLMIGALYAFTDCEVSISPNACVIVDDKPMFLPVSEILKVSTQQTKALLKRELEIRKNELLEKLLFSSLEKIFIENRIYRDIEECETWEAVIKTIDKGLDPYKKDFYREITTEDIVKLTEIKIKRISKFDTFKANELMNRLQDELATVEYNLKNLVEYAVSFFKNLGEKYGKGKERKTELKGFEAVNRTVVAANNQKLYVNLKDGFAGYGMKKEMLICECSDMDDIIVIRRDGTLIVKRVKDKDFFGKDILHIAVWKKGDERMTYNMVYLDGTSGRSMVKRFNVTSITRDKAYDLTKGNKGSKVLYLSANPNGEAEILTIKLTAQSTARKKIFDFNLADIDIKGRGAGGNILTKYPIRRIEVLQAGVSTLSGLDLFYDATIGLLNKDKTGTYIGNFNGEDQIVAIHKNGEYEVTSFELTNRYDASSVFCLLKYTVDHAISVIYFDGEEKAYFGKSFIIETTSINKRFAFAPGSKNRVEFASLPDVKSVKIKGYQIGQSKVSEQEIDMDDVAPFRSSKAHGNKLGFKKVSKISIGKHEPFKVNKEAPAKKTPPQQASLFEDKPGFKPGDEVEL